jgi:hypothetical protein
VYPSADTAVSGLNQRQPFGNALEKFAFASGGDATNSFKNGVLSPTLGFAFNVVNRDSHDPNADIFAYYMSLQVYWTFPGGPSGELFSCFSLAL